LFLCFIKHHAMNTYWGEEVSFHALISALDRGERSASRPGRFTPGVRTPGTHWITRLGGSQSRSGRVRE